MFKFPRWLEIKSERFDLKKNLVKMELSQKIPQNSYIKTTDDRCIRGIDNKTFSMSGSACKTFIEVANDGCIYIAQENKILQWNESEVKPIILVPVLAMTLHRKNILGVYETPNKPSLFYIDSCKINTGNQGIFSQEIKTKYKILDIKCVDNFAFLLTRHSVQAWKINPNNNQLFEKIDDEITIISNASCFSVSKEQNNKRNPNKQIGDTIVVVVGRENGCLSKHTFGKKDQSFSSKIWKKETGTKVNCILSDISDHIIIGRDDGSIDIRDRKLDKKNNTIIKWKCPVTCLAKSGKFSFILGDQKGNIAVFEIQPNGQFIHIASTKTLVGAISSILVSNTRELFILGKEGKIALYSYFPKLSRTNVIKFFPEWRLNKSVRTHYTDYIIRWLIVWYKSFLSASVCAPKLVASLESKVLISLTCKEAAFCTLLSLFKNKKLKEMIKDKKDSLMLVLLQNDINTFTKTFIEMVNKNKIKKPSKNEIERLLKQKLKQVNRKSVKISKSNSLDLNFSDETFGLETEKWKNLRGSCHSEMESTKGSVSIKRQAFAKWHGGDEYKNILKQKVRSLGLTSNLCFKLAVYMGKYLTRVTKEDESKIIINSLNANIFHFLKERLRYSQKVSDVTCKITKIKKLKEIIKSVVEKGHQVPSGVTSLNDELLNGNLDGAIEIIDELQLVSKYPEFKKTEKGKEIMDLINSISAGDLCKSLKFINTSSGETIKLGELFNMQANAFPVPKTTVSFKQLPKNLYQYDARLAFAGMQLTKELKQYKKNLISLIVKMNQFLGANVSLEEGSGNYGLKTNKKQDFIAILKKINMFVVALEVMNASKLGDQDTYVSDLAKLIKGQLGAFKLTPNNIGLYYKVIVDNFPDCCNYFLSHRLEALLRALYYDTYFPS